MQDFSAALAGIRRGERWKRLGWLDDQFIFLVQGSKFVVNRPPLNVIYPEGTVIDYQPRIDIALAGGRVAVWHPVHADLLSIDWVTAPAAAPRAATTA